MDEVHTRLFHVCRRKILKYNITINITINIIFMNLLLETNIRLYQFKKELEELTQIMLNFAECTKKLYDSHKPEFIEARLKYNNNYIFMNNKCTFIRTKIDFLETRKKYISANYRYDINKKQSCPRCLVIELDDEQIICKPCFGYYEYYHSNHCKICTDKVNNRIHLHCKSCYDKFSKVIVV